MNDFINIYNSYHLQVRSILFRYSGSEEQLDDMVQEAFVKIWKNQRKFEGKSSLKTWIYRIAINSAIDCLRKNKRHTNLATYEDIHIQDNSTEATITNQQLINCSLQKLSDTHRQVVILSIYQELKINEIAEILEIPQGTVKSRLHLAKADILKDLKSQGINNLENFSEQEGEHHVI